MVWRMPVRRRCGPVPAVVRRPRAHRAMMIVLRWTPRAIVRTMCAYGAARAGTIIAVARTVVPVAGFLVWAVWLVRLARTVWFARVFGALCRTVVVAAVVVMLMAAATVARTR